ncbi:hypothetical protein IPC962_25325 [Pseudomonas aeruginosa]|nr:hypothetical protein IPC962_25325 [Pseudomonas aeruginosa]
MSEWSEDRLIAHGKDVIHKMLPIFLIDAEKPSEADAHFYIKQFIELLEEGRIRGFDLRKVLKEISKAK